MGLLFGYSIPLPQSFLDPIEAKITELLRPILGPIRAVVDIFTRVRTILPDTVADATALVDSAIHEYRAFTSFDFRTSPRTRVIQSIRAVQELSDLITKVPQDVLAKVKDLISIVRSRFGTADVFETSDIEGLEDLRGLISKLGPKLARAFEKVLGVLALVLDTIGAVRNTIADLQGIVDDIKHVRESLTHLKGFFLPQDNKRERVYLEDGTMIYRRIPGTGGS